MMEDAMDSRARSGRLSPLTLVMLMLAMVAGMTPTAWAEPKGVVIRGCLNGSKLTHIDPDDATLSVPDILRVTSLRVIRSQVKALDGHQVEVIGTLSGIPGQDKSVLVADSDKARLYVGGGDKNLGEDFGTARSEPPTIHARTIKDVAASCTAGPSK
jgi:hypothetical protein